MHKNRVLFYSISPKISGSFLCPEAENLGRLSRQQTKEGQTNGLRRKG